MAEPTPGSLKRTPLYDFHVASGGRIVPFAGFEMPVQYSGVIEEHVTVRTRVGLFDVSHMGEIEIEGPGALATVQRVTTNDASKLAIGRAQYSGLTTPDGTFHDDLLVYRRGEDRFLLVVNASNQDKDFAWIRDHAEGGCRPRFASPDWAQIAIQGPKALEIFRPLASQDPGTLRYYAFFEGEACGARAIVSRTGYTGEDGFEVYVRPEDATPVWQRLLEAGRPHGILPCGLGARDTLRLEAKMALYGNDIDDTTTPLEADLGWIVKLDKGEFIGSARLREQSREGVKRLLAGFEMTDRAIARHGYPILLAGKEYGKVTSGAPAPFCKRNIGLAYLPKEHARPGFEFEVVVREKPMRARVVETPFYKRPKT